MQSSLLPVVVVVALLVGSIPAVGETSKAQSSSFRSAQVRVVGENLVVGSWVPNPLASKKSAVRVAVVATWCPHSSNLMTALDKYDFVRKHVDALVVFDSELSTIRQKLDEAVKGGEITKARAKQIYDQVASRPYPLFDPKVLANRKLPVFMVKMGAFDNRGFPAYVTCTREKCAETEGLDLIYPALGEREEGGTLDTLLKERHISRAERTTEQVFDALVRSYLK